MARHANPKIDEAMEITLDERRVEWNLEDFGKKKNKIFTAMLEVGQQVKPALETWFHTHFYREREGQPWKRS